MNLMISETAPRLTPAPAHANVTADILCHATDERALSAPRKRGERMEPPNGTRRTLSRRPRVTPRAVPRRRPDTPDAASPAACRR